MQRESGLREPRGVRALSHRMINDRGVVIGRVEDVRYGGVSSEASTDGLWAVVATGRFGTERFVPLHEAYLASDGNVVVPYDETTVEHAPRAGNHCLLPALRAALAAYYGT